MIEGRDFAAASTVGARTRQEDDWGTHVNPPAREAGARLLAAVADGMGGMPAGEQASGIALRAFLDSYRVIELPAGERMRHALAHANREVGIAAEADPDLAGMGCTLVTSLFFPDSCAWLSVGDSLILHCRNGELKRINPLHVYANELDEMVRRGELSEDAARKNPERAALTSAIQGTVLAEVAQGEFALEADDVVMLASDGILTLPDDEIVSICAAQAEQGAERIAEAIVEGIDALGRPGQDNATLVVVCHKSGADDGATVPQAAPKVAATVPEEPGEAAAATPKLPGAQGSDVPSNESCASAGAAAAVTVATRRHPAESVSAANHRVERIAQPVPGKPQVRTSLTGIRLLWLAAAFVLGAVCGAVGGYVL